MRDLIGFGWPLVPAVIAASRQGHNFPEARPIEFPSRRSSPSDLARWELSIIGDRVQPLSYIHFRRLRHGVQQLWECCSEAEEVSEGIGLMKK